MSRKFKNCPYIQYTDEQLQFLQANIKGRSYTKLAALFNEYFNIAVSRHAVSEVCRYYGYSNDKPERQRYTTEQIEFLRENVKKHYYHDLTVMFNEHFGTSATLMAIREACRCRNMPNRLNGGFQKGHKLREGCALPDGVENVNVAGYRTIKRNGVWIGKHVAIWEEVYGTVPEGHYIVFGDGDRTNLNIDNLYCVSAAQSGIRSRLGLKGAIPELAEAGIALAGLYARINERQKKNSKCN